MLVQQLQQQPVGVHGAGEGDDSPYSARCSHTHSNAPLSISWPRGPLVGNWGGQAAHRADAEGCPETRE